RAAELQRRSRTALEALDGRGGRELRPGRRGGLRRLRRQGLRHQPGKRRDGERDERPRSPDRLLQTSPWDDLLLRRPARATAPRAGRSLLDRRVGFAVRRAPTCRGYYPRKDGKRSVPGQGTRFSESSGGTRG